MAILRAPACAAPRERSHTEHGFSLVEALIASSVAAVAALVTAHLAVTSARLAHRATQQSATTVLAAARLEQLQALPWWFVEGPGGSLEARSDTTTDVGVDPIGTGGRGLAPAPAEALVVSSAGNAEFLDRDGRSLGLLHAPPAGARFVRRWSAWPSADDPDHTLVLAVRVTPLDASLAAGEAAPVAPLHGETWLVTLRSRTRP
jgi:type II secretory pathway pseudopilin PulG